MASTEFIKYFESSEEISIGEFFKKEFFTCSTPKKFQINLSNQPIEKIISQIRNEIFYNLRINQDFMQNAFKFDKNTLKSFYELLRDTESTFDENQKMQLIFLLHVSKSSASLDLFDIIFNKIKYCVMVENINTFEFGKEADDLFEKILKSKIIKENVKSVVEEISGKNDLKDCQIKKKFFSFELAGLGGFCGVNEIYLNVEMLNYMFNETLFMNYNKDEKMKIFRLHFTSLAIHEITHMVLRFNIDDLNVSSPTIYKKKQKPDIIEAGVICEKKLFKAVIDWKTSALKSKFNVNYYSLMLKKILEDENIVFDSSELAIFKEPPVLMTVYFFSNSTRLF